MSELAPSSTGIGLVTGANGHLGSHLVRALRRRGTPVRATVRDPRRAGSLQGVDAEVVRADLLDPPSLRAAMRGVDTLFHVAAAFRHWARDVEREVIAPTVEGTRNVLEAAAEAGVRRVVYVSSTVTLDPDRPVDGPVADRSWCPDDHGNPYVRAKVAAERLAWELADELELELVSALPATIVGPTFGGLTPSMRLLEDIRGGRLPVAPDLRFRFVDVEDVAAGLIAAADHGIPRRCYVLAGDATFDPPRLAELAREVDHRVRTPRLLPRGAALAIAGLMEAQGRVLGREPAFLRSQVRLWSGAAEAFDAGRARDELGWRPRSSEDAVRRCFADLATRQADAIAA